MYTLTMNMNVANMENAGLRTLSFEELDYISGGEINWGEVAHVGFVATFSVIGGAFGSATTFGFGGAVGAVGGAIIGEVIWQVIV